jgi:hypothetical protein
MTKHSFKHKWQGVVYLYLLKFWTFLTKWGIIHNEYVLHHESPSKKWSVLHMLSTKNMEKEEIDKTTKN